MDFLTESELRIKEVESWQSVLFVKKAFTSVTESAILIEDPTKSGALTLNL